VTNPYEPPGVRVPPANAVLRIFTPAAVAIHFFVVPPVGAVLGILNYRRLREQRGFWTAVALYCASVMALIGLAVVLRAPEMLPLMWAMRAVGAFLIFRDQRPLVRAHFAAGGRKARWFLGWLAALPICMLYLAIWQLLAPAERRPDGPPSGAPISAEPKPPPAAGVP
jgi:hypothetical protein